MTDRIALIGLPGSGKSTVGELLASRLEARYIDIDRSIEELSGWHAVNWIEQKGLPAYRAAEALFMATLEGNKSRKVGRMSLVVSTGGGVVEIPYVREILGRWKCIWLDATDKVLISRCDPSTRPLLRHEDGGELVMARLRIIREPYYLALAGDPIDTLGIAPSSVVDVILSRLEEDRE